MAQHTKVVLTDDLDGTTATHTHHLTLDGRTVRLDLNDTHSADLVEQVGGWLEAGSPVRQHVRRAPAATRPVTLTQRERAEVHLCARTNGYPIGDRGRIAAHIIDAWRAARGKS